MAYIKKANGVLLEASRVDVDPIVWDDVVIPSTSVRLGGASPASEQAYRGGLVSSFSSLSDNFVYFTAQLPHKYKVGTDVTFHIHWTIPTDGLGVGAENVKWDFTYSASDPSSPGPYEIFPVESSKTITIDVQDMNQHEHRLSSFGAIDGSGFGISNTLICSLKRDVGVGSDYGSAVYLVSLDFHFQIDTLGSDSIDAK